MRVAIYGRVSTSHQVEHQTIEQRLRRLTAHVGAHAAEGWMLDPAYVFRDDGCSGAALARPGLDRLRDAVKGREIDRVLVTTPDRLARNYVHQMVLLEEWARAGCAAEFLDRPMSDDPHDHLLLQIRGAVAEYERTLIAERMRRGRLAKLRAGVLLPWTYAPYGYRVSPDRPRDLERRVQALASQEEQLRCDAARQQQLAGIAASVEAFRARVHHGLAEATFAQRRQLVLLLIERVVVTDAEVEIRYVLPTSPESEHVRFCHLRKDYFHHPAPL